jgi:hypothetical protein
MLNKAHSYIPATLFHIVNTDGNMELILCNIYKWESDLIQILQKNEQTSMAQT